MTKAEVEIGKPFGLALGVFDGFHLGHQAVIQGARGALERVGVMTFDPHPVEVLAPGKAPQKIISTIEHQAHVLAQLEVDFLVVVEFTPDFAAIPAEEFAKQLTSCGANRLAAGSDWNFGKGRSGNLQKLKSWASGIEVIEIPPVLLEEERISSSAIRAALRNNDLELAAQLLGRPYSVYGEVIKGRQLGRQLGFPTANVSVSETALPANGVYQIDAHWGGKTASGVANVGVKPTVDDAQKRSLEVHLFSKEVPHKYGWMIGVSFGKKIREEKTFDSIDELKEQIERDIAHALT